MLRLNERYKKRVHTFSLELFGTRKKNFKIDLAVEAR